MNNPETIALEKKDQTPYSRKIRRLKQKVKSGKISIKDLKKERKLKAEETRGLIYIGHLPHGFYEDEIRAYFKQFGIVTNVKVCRSRCTGNSKGYGFVEFAHPEVAKIAAETMNNYLMFKKRVVAEFIPFKKRPKALFYGKQSTPTNYSASRRQMRFAQSKNKQLDDETYLAKSKQALKKFQKKMEKLRKFGIDYDLRPVDVPDTLVKDSRDSPQTSEFDDSDVELNISKIKPKNVKKATKEGNSVSKSTMLEKPKKNVKKASKTLEKSKTVVTKMVKDKSKVMEKPKKVFPKRNIKVKK